MTVWELAGLMCFASFLIPIIWFFVVKFGVIARRSGEQAAEKTFPSNGRKHG